MASVFSLCFHIIIIFNEYAYKNAEVSRETSDLSTDLIMDTKYFFVLQKHNLHVI
jgi:hypothetical protein